MKAKTDSGPTEANSEMPDYIKNIFQLMQLVSTADTHASFLQAYNDCNIRYGDMKKQLAEDMAVFVKPIREKAIELQKDEDALRKILIQGAEQGKVQPKLFRLQGKLSGSIIINHVNT
jgi:tryptophanyl-tRNA synthetase